MQRTPLPAALNAKPFTIAQAHAAGVRIGRTNATDLVRPFYGVRAQTGSLVTLTDACRALAVRMPPAQFFSHATAALIHGMPLPRRLDSDPTLHVSAIRPGRAPRLRGVIGHTVDEAPELRRTGGLVVLSPASAWCNLAPLLTLDELIAAGDRLLGFPEPLATSEEIAGAVRAYSGRRGARKLREASAWLRPRVESPRETRLRLLLIRAGLPEPEPNGVITFAAPGATKTRGDLVYRRYRVLTEYDGEQHRTDPRQFVHDVARLNNFSAEEWIVVRVDKYMSDAEAVARTRSALLSRGWRP